MILIYNATVYLKLPFYGNICIDILRQQYCNFKRACIYRIKMIRVSQFRAQYRVSEIQNSHYRVSEITPYRALLFQNGKIDMIDLAIFANRKTMH